MSLDRGFHPAEYFGLFIRWKINQLTRDKKKEDLVSFNEFKKERLGLIDFVIGFGTLAVIVILLFLLYSIIVLYQISRD